MHAAVALAVAAILAAGAAADDTEVAAPTPARVPVAVVGVGIVAGSARVATMRWSYERDGVVVETTVPPRMLVTRLSSNVPLMMVKLPTELFGIRIDHDLQRILEDPLLVDSKAEATCSCAMRPDCGSGATFRCEVEAWLQEGGG